MIHRQLIFAFALTAAFIFFILYPPWISWYLFVLLLLLIPIDLFISLPGMLSKSVLISAPVTVDTDSDSVLTLITVHKKSYPARCIIARFHASGDGFSVICRIKCSADKGARREISIDTTRSGLTVFEIKRIWTVSLIGLFAFPSKVKLRETVLVLPPAVKPAATMALQQGIKLRPKPGGGFSEEHDMRVYRPGDPVKSIHWKISAKFDSMIIREPLVLPPHSRLIHVVGWRNASERDLILGRLRWVSDYLINRRMPYYIKYQNDEMITEIENESELISFLRGVLDKHSDKIKPISVIPARFSWVFRIDAGMTGAVEKTKKREVI